MRAGPEEGGPRVFDRGREGVLGGEPVGRSRGRVAPEWAARKRQALSWVSRSPTIQPPPWKWTSIGRGGGGAPWGT